MLWKSRNVQVMRAGVAPLLFVAWAFVFSAPGLAQDSSVSSAIAPALEGEAGQQTGRVSGIIVDQSGAHVIGVTVTLSRPGATPDQQAVSDDQGQFLFTAVEPGPFHLTINLPGFSPLTYDGTVQPGEACTTPLMVVKLATVVTEVHVALTQEQIAREQVREQETQRIFGFPNFFATYDPNPVPLPAKYKFRLAWRSTTDPITVFAVGVEAGLSQAGGQWSGYGQGAQGYAKRFGAAYADVLSGSFLGSAVLPSLLNQDPRYFYRGTGSRRSRIFHALKGAVLCKGDDGRDQVNYSNILGSVAAGGISTLYRPSNGRNAAGALFATALIRIGGTAVANIFSEFIVPKSKSRVLRQDANQ